MQNALSLVFFTQAFATITYIPRIPELIDQIHVSFATWGLIIGFAGLGSLLPLLIANRLISRFGTLPLIVIASQLLCGSLMLLPLTHNAGVFFAIQIAMAFFGSFFNVALNAQAVMFQKKVNRVIIGRFHAAWSIGAVASASLAGLLAGFMPLWLHLILVPGMSAVIIFIATRFLMKPAEDGHAEERVRAERTSFFKSPSLLWLLAVGFFAGIFPEFCMMDWSAVFAKQELGLSVTLGAIPYTVFTAAMIFGRLSITRLTKRFHISDLSRWGGIVGSVVLAASIFIGPWVGKSNQFAGLVVLSAMWAVVGLGISPMVPSFFSAAGFVKGLTTSQALSRMSLVNQVSLMFSKVAVGAIAQGAGLVVAFLVPTVSLFAAGVLAGQVAKLTPRIEKLLDAFPTTGPLTVVDEL